MALSPFIILTIFVIFGYQTIGSLELILNLAMIGAVATVLAIIFFIFTIANDRRKILNGFIKRVRNTEKKLSRA